MVTSITCPASTWAMNSLNLNSDSFFWIWAKCQARMMTTSNDNHSITVLNVEFTVSSLSLVDRGVPPRGHAAFPQRQCPEPESPWPGPVTPHLHHRTHSVSLPPGRPASPPQARVAES